MKRMMKINAIFMTSRMITQPSFIAASPRMKLVSRAVLTLKSKSEPVIWTNKVRKGIIIHSKINPTPPSKHWKKPLKDQRVQFDSAADAENGVTTASKITVAIIAILIIFLLLLPIE